MATVTRAHLRDVVHHETGLPRREAAELVDTVIEAVAERLAAGETRSSSPGSAPSRCETREHARAATPGPARRCRSRPTGWWPSGRQGPEVADRGRSGRRRQGNIGARARRLLSGARRSARSASSSSSIADVAEPLRLHRCMRRTTALRRKEKVGHAAGVSNRTRLEWRRGYAGPAFLSEGFRPLFLAAGLWAAVSVPLWIGVWSGEIAYAGLFGPVTWHIHEMMFGFVSAALGGFVLTAVPNWTGHLPVRGIPLAALALAWLAGRAAVWWSDALGPIPTAFADLAFLGALAVLVGKEIVAGRNWRNLPVLAGLALMVAANALFHLGAADVADVEEAGARLSIAVMSFLVALVGGRIVPSFTRNWFARRRGRKIAAPMGRFDRATIAATAIALAAWVVSAPEYVSGALLAASERST